MSGTTPGPVRTHSHVSTYPLGRGRKLGRVIYGSHLLVHFLCSHNIRSFETRRNDTSPPWILTTIVGNTTHSRSKEDPEGS